MVVQERTQTQQPGSPKLASGTQPESVASQVVAGRWLPAPDGCLPHMLALPPCAPTPGPAILGVGPACRIRSLGITVTLASITTGPRTHTGYGWLQVLLLFTFFVSFQASVATFLLTV